VLGSQAGHGVLTTRNLQKLRLPFLNTEHEIGNPIARLDRRCRLNVDLIEALELRVNEMSGEDSHVTAG
jgi:hypothetical protein